VTPEEVAASYAEADSEGAVEIDDDPELGDAEFGNPGYDECDPGDSDTTTLPSVTWRTKTMTTT
jgi:hypothetical protein